MKEITWSAWYAVGSAWRPIDLWNEAGSWRLILKGQIPKSEYSIVPLQAWITFFVLWNINKIRSCMLLFPYMHNKWELMFLCFKKRCFYD